MDKYDRKLAMAASLIIAFLAFGTVFYHAAEGWPFVDSFYFSGITLTTVGYGDLYPTHALSKIVTVLFAFAGIGMVFYSMSIIAQRYFERQEERLHTVWNDRTHPVRQVARRVNELAEDVGVHELARKLAKRKGLKAGFVPDENLSKYRMIRGKP